MLSIRWKKIFADLREEKKKVLLMTGALIISLSSVGTIMGAYSIIMREMGLNYLGTNPASATIETDGDVEDEMVKHIKSLPYVEDAEARDVIVARAKIGREWRPILLFVVKNFQELKLNTFRKISGVLPYRENSMMLERSAVSVMDADAGGIITVKAPNGKAVEITVTGLVHDPSLAPARQERSGYGYIAKAMLPNLGEAPVLHELRILVRDDKGDAAKIEMKAKKIADELARSGYRIHEIRVPNPLKHPHQSQTQTLLVILLIFSVMALLLSGILVAATLSAILARQVREIGVMKTFGANSWQIAGIYLAMIFFLGLLSYLPAMPAGVMGARFFSNAVGNLLNFEIISNKIPLSIYLMQFISGIIVPIFVSIVPIRKAGKITVKEALENHGVGTARMNEKITTLPATLRNMLRRPARLAFTIGLLSAGGAMFMTSINVMKSWDRNMDKFYEARHYDVEFRFHAPQPAALGESLKNLKGIKNIEHWGISPTALSKNGETFEIKHTYPDKGHGAFFMLAPPAGTTMVSFPVKSGRWLRDDDIDAVVLNHTAQFLSKASVGDHITLSLEGKKYEFLVAGIVEEIGAPAGAYISGSYYEKISGSTGSPMYRISTDSATDEERKEIIHDIENKLAESGVSVERGIPLEEHRTAMGEHIMILIKSLIFMAVTMALVGMLGLGSTMSINVIERTREIGIMKTLGASSQRILKMVISESLITGMMSWLIALILSLLITYALNFLIGTMGFVAPLPFIASWQGMLLWLILSGIVSLAATIIPARSASGMQIKDALVQV